MNDRTCDHCGREATSEAAGGTLIRVPIYKPTDHETVIGYQELYVCNPTVRFRPRCYRLIFQYGHTKDCAPCLRNYPPGMETRVVDEESRWAIHTQWVQQAA